METELIMQILAALGIFAGGSGTVVGGQKLVNKYRNGGNGACPHVNGTPMSQEAHDEGCDKRFVNFKSDLEARIDHGYQMLQKDIAHESEMSRTRHTDVEKKVDQVLNRIDQWQEKRN